VTMTYRKAEDQQRISEDESINGVALSKVCNGVEAALSTASAISSENMAGLASAIIIGSSNENGQPALAIRMLAIARAAWRYWSK